MRGFVHTRRMFVALGVACLLAATLAIPAGWVLGSPGSDLLNQFVAWRQFAADSLRSGHIPLWNPYTFSGEPFLGGFQSAVLYPPNLLFLILPLARAINLSIVGHLAWLGLGMGRWARSRGFHPIAAALVGFAVPLSGPVFPHVYAGHLPNLCTMAWAPWILLCLEEWHRGGRGAALLWACAAACMQLLAGHVQYAFYTAVAAGLAALVRAVANPAERRRAVPGVLVCYLAAAALGAVQLLPGLAATGESVRQGGLDFRFISSFSFPPENLLTLFAPGFFGDLPGFSYWGSCYFWEMSVFVGASGAVLAALSLEDRGHRRGAGLDLVVAGLLFTLALGYHTPLFRVLFDHAPGFDRFRGLSKFTFPALLYFSLAIGAGADALIRNRPGRRLVAAFAIGAAAAAILAGLCLRHWPEHLAGAMLRGIERSWEIHNLSATVLSDPAFQRGAGIRAGRALVVAGMILFAAGASLAWSRRSPRLRWVPLLLLPIEMVCFARANLATAPVAAGFLDKVAEFIAATPGDYRMLWLNPTDTSDAGYLIGAPTIWGNDPFVLRRYAEFIAYTQGEDPDRVTQYVEFRKLSPLYAMLRCRFVFGMDPAGRFTVLESSAAMHRVQLVQEYRVLPGRDPILAAMARTGFDPRRTVLLESEPEPRPAASPDPGTARVLSASAGSMTVEADLKVPAVLLVTDPYSRDWHARSLPGSSQSAYRILPADHCLQAVPMGAGHHLLRIEYSPVSFKIGIAVSAAAWLAWAAAATSWRPSWRRPSGA